MNNQILVTYASKYGATAGIAEKVASLLEAAGLEVALLPINQGIDLAPYRAVVWGSPIYVGRWRPEAVHFLENQLDALNTRDVWLFSSGPTGEGDPTDLLDGWSYPRQHEELIEQVAPHDVKLFHGAIDPNKIDELEKNTIKQRNVEVGDFRDWEMITAWGTAIAEKLQTD